MWRISESTMRLSAMMRRYSSGEKKASTPSFSSRVPLLRKIHGMKATNPYRPGGHSDLDQVLDALARRLDVAVHHRGRRGQSESVGRAHDRQPAVGVGLSGRYGPPHAVIENLGPGSGQRIEAGVHQPAQRRLVVERADAGDVGDLGCAESVQLQRGIKPLELAEQVLVKVDAELGMQSALQQQLVAPQSKRLVDFPHVLVDRRHIGPFPVVRLAVEIAELAARDADVRNIDVAVDLPCDRAARHVLLPQLPCQRHQFVQRPRFIKDEGFVGGQEIESEGFAVDFFHIHRYAAGRDTIKPFLARGTVLLRSVRTYSK